MRHIVRRAVVALLMVQSASAAAVDITACEQTVAAGAVGVLQTDLTCDMNGVRLESGATLQLAGHELTGGNNIAVYCPKSRCAIEGPGTISGADWIGVYMASHVRVSVRDVVFRGTDVGILGTYSGGQKVTLENVTFEDVRQWSLSARTLVAKNVTVHGNGGQFFAIAAASTRIVGGDISNNAGTGVQGNKIRLENVTVTGNAGIGVDSAKSIALIGSTAVGNAAADLRSTHRPRLVSSTCGHSIDETGATWGVCAGD